MLWWAAQNLVVASILAAGTWAVCRFTRIGPTARHALWLIVLIKLVTPPMFVWPWAVPGPLGLLRASSTTDASKRTAPPVRNATPVPQVATARGAFGSAHPSGDAAEPAPPTRPLRIAVAGSITASPATVRPQPWLWSWVQPARILIALPEAWMAGSILLALLQLRRIVRMIRMARSGRASDVALSQRIQRLAGRMGMHAIPVRTVDQIDSPMVWALARPMLLWPAGLSATVSDASIDGLIVHELAHVRRRDHWVGWLELLAGLLWWWNPLYWYARHQLRENAELACDGWVIGTLPSGRRAYAEALLAVCQCMSERRSAPAPALGVGTGGRQFLERRLAMILRDRVPLRLPRIGFAMIGLLTMTTIPAWSQKTITGITASGPGQLTISDDGRRASLSASAVTIDVTRDPLPPEAQELIAQYQQHQADAWREMEQRLARKREDVVRQLKELQDRFTKAGKLDEAVAVRDHVRALEAQNQEGAPGMLGGFPGGGGGAMGGAVLEPPERVAPDPGNLMQFRDRVGQTLLFHVVGSTEGSVWGKGIYTDDSSLAAAAVHTGILRPGQAGDVRVKILPGREAYEGGSQNGIDSRPYAAWEGSYQFQLAPETWKGSYQFLTTPKIGAEPSGGPVGAEPGQIQFWKDVQRAFPGDFVGAGRGQIPESPDKPLHADRPPEPGNLEDLHGQPGRTLAIEVTGSTTGPIWGGADNVYSEDSDPATAAVHAGILRPGERGTIVVTILPDRGHYEASTHNLVESRSWGPWHGSYRIAGASHKPGAGAPPRGAAAP